MEKHSLNFSSEYYQFYILDSKTTAQTDANDFWCPDAGTRRLAIGEGLLGVTIATYGNVKGEIHILTQKPELDKTADHVVEASIKLSSGILEVKDCTGYETQLAINLPKTTYRIRISSHNLGSVKDDEGQDFYTLEIWKSRFAKPAILKAFVNNPFQN
jgi:hypothetical protein